MSEITLRARKLRKEPTEAEKELWKYIRYERLGIKFRRQYPIIFMDNRLRRCFIADFVNLESRVIIELDGEIHQFQKEYDEIRTQIIERFGYRIYRFHNDEVINGIVKVIKKIRQYCLPHGDGEGALSEVEGRMGA